MDNRRIEKKVEEDQIRFHGEQIWPPVVLVMVVIRRLGWCGEDWNGGVDGWPGATVVVVGRGGAAVIAVVGGGGWVVVVLDEVG